MEKVEPAYYKKSLNHINFERLRETRRKGKIYTFLVPKFGAKIKICLCSKL